MATTQEEGRQHPVDRHVGSRLRLRRGYLRLTQEFLGTSLGCTYQQIQKYETGSNRIPASRLFELAVLLDVPVGFFFEGLGRGDRMVSAPAGDGASPADGASPVGLQGQNRRPGGFRMSQDILDLIEGYNQLPDPKVQRDVLSLIRILARATR